MDDKIQQLIDDFFFSLYNLLNNGVEIIDSRSGEPLDDIGFRYDDDDEGE